MDRILEGYLNGFVQEYDLQDLNEAQAFELFVNYCILSRIHTDSFDLDIVSVGGGNDTGIDGIAIIVNDYLVSSKEEIDYFKKHLRRLDVKFVFIQAKTSDKFDMGSIGNFFFGVRSFFESSSLININTHIQDMRVLKEYIYDSSIDMDKSPICEMYYVTTGNWTGDSNLLGRIKAEVDSLRETQLFSNVTFNPIDADHLKKIYRELKNKVIKKINFEKHTALPPIHNVTQAYIGVLPALEYLKLITDDDGNLQRNLFYDNVRDYQGHNPVNQEIASTISNTSESDSFALLNNGITIVAKSVTQVGTMFTIRDYQIVNGCQTSHVLHLNRRFLSDKVFLPVKLIVTDNIDITNLVIKATNRQTEVKIEAFESLQPFHKELEEFYNTLNLPGRQLYYERRSKQYDSFPIEKNQMISIATQAKCFLAMFLNEPHSTHRYYGELLKSNEEKIFLDTHHPYPYYISGYSMYLLEQFFHLKEINPRYKQFRYHILMVFRLLSEKSSLPFLNSRKIENYCSDLRDILWDRSHALTVFHEALQIVEQALANSMLNAREATRRKVFTSALISLVTSQKNLHVQAASTRRERGVVKWFSDVRGFGFITDSKGLDVFVHHKDIWADGFRYLLPGETVEYVRVKTERGFNAKEVEIVDSAP